MQNILFLESTNSLKILLSKKEVEIILILKNVAITK